MRDFTAEIKQAPSTNICFSKINFLTSNVRQQEKKRQLLDVCTCGTAEWEMVESESGVESDENNPLPM